MKVLIYFAVHQRLEILKVCLAGIKRLQKHSTAIEYIPFAVCSTKKESTVLSHHGVQNIIHPNQPLGAKKNAGLRAALLLEWDYLLELGSDDLIHESLMDAYLTYMQSGVDFFGVRKVMFYDTISKQVAQWENGFVIGAGRMIKRSVFTNVKNKVRIRILKHFANEHLLGIPGREITVTHQTAADLTGCKMAEIIDESPLFKLWDDEKQSGLDNNSMLTICSSGYKLTTVPSEYWHVLDIKSAQNINGFEWFDAIDYDVLKHYPGEAETIKRL